MVKQLSLKFAGLVTLTFVLTVVILFSFFRSKNEENYFDTLELFAEQLKLTWLDDEDALASQSRIIQQLYQNQFGKDLTILVLHESGDILYSSNPHVTVGKEMIKPEFQEIFQGEEKFLDHRFQAGSPYKYYYFSLAVPRYAAAIRLSAVYQPDGTTFIPVLLSLLALSVGLTLGSRRLVHTTYKSYDSCLEDLDTAGLQLEQGRYDYRLPELKSLEHPYIYRVTKRLNELARVLEQRQRENQGRIAKLNTVLDSSNDPLLMVNELKTLLYINRKAKELFDRGLDPVATPFPQILLTHSQELDRLIDDSMHSGQIKTGKVHFISLHDDKHYHAYVTPIFLGDESQGSVVALHDQTMEEQAAAFRRDFVANVTHELKTPLTSIRGFIDTLRHVQDISPEQTEHFLNIMDKEAIRLEDLIDDILSLSEIEHGKVKTVSAFDLSELIDEVIVLLDEQASAAHVSVFTADDMPDRLMVHAERDRIKQILINLVDNAIKYNDQEQGRVQISARRQGDYVTLVVNDNGPGISPEAQKRIYERFYRVDTGRSRSLGGTGLGLAIVKHIAQLYNGTAELESEVGKGASFKVTLQI